MKLKYKLFIALVTSSCLILLLAVGVMQFTIRKNFIGFLNDVEFRNQTVMIDLLKNSYTRHSGWDVFKANPRVWHDLIGSARSVQGVDEMIPPVPGGDPAVVQNRDQDRDQGRAVLNPPNQRFFPMTQLPCTAGFACLMSRKTMWPESAARTVNLIITPLCCQTGPSDIWAWRTCPI